MQSLILTYRKCVQIRMWLEAFVILVVLVMDQSALYLPFSTLCLWHHGWAPSHGSGVWAQRTPRFFVVETAEQILTCSLKPRRRKRPLGSSPWNFEGRDGSIRCLQQRASSRSSDQHSSCGLRTWHLPLRGIPGLSRRVAEHRPQHHGLQSSGGQRRSGSERRDAKQAWVNAIVV